MAITKTDPSTLPTLDDFQESSLLSKSQLEADNAAAEAEAEAEKAKNDAAEKAKTTVSSADAKLTAAQEAEAKKKAEADAEAVRKTAAEATKEKNKQISKEALEALIAKADKDVDSLTDEEAQILIDNDILEEKQTSTFWEDVNKVNGLDLQVDFGDVDPESVQGAAIRDKALIDNTLVNYIEHLKTNYPESYKLLEHEANGGKITDLLPVDRTDYLRIELKEDDVETQKEVLADFYRSKGFDDKRIIRLIEADEDSKEGLFEAAKGALTEQQAAQKAQEAKIIAETKQKAEAAKARDNSFKSVMKEITEAGKIGEFEIKDKKQKAEFYNYLLSNTYFNDKTGNYQVVLPITQETLTPVMQQMLFSYKGGKLDEFVKRAAETKLVRKLQKKVSQDTNKTSSQENNTQIGVKKLPTLDVFTVQQ